MKILTKSISLLIVIAIFLSAFCFNISATSPPSICNTGIRHSLCDSLSDMAEAYYTAGYDYETLSEKNSAELLTSLRGFMKDTHTHSTSYADCRDLPMYTDSQGNDQKIVLLYSSVSVTQDEWAGSGSVGWNREHVWPQSLGGFKTSGAGADLHHVRPADYSLNGKRGNKLYGNVEGGSPVTGTSIVSGMVGGESKDDYFEPLDNVKGDVARICLYVFARYGGEITECSKITNVFQSVEVLLEWCELDPVDDWEMGRNDVVEVLQGNRNVFIDYPEYAWLLFDEEIPDGMTTPTSASRANNEEQGGGSNENEGESSGQTPSEPETNEPEANEPETNAPETNAPETNAPETNVPTDSESVVKPTEENNGKDDNNDGDDDSVTVGGDGCASSLAISSICVVGIFGIAAIVKKKED